MNYQKTAYQIIKDKIKKENIDTALEEWNDFILHGNKSNKKEENNLVEEIETYLYEIKSDLLISRFIDKKPYIKSITKDKIINITGESGSGKSYYSKKYINDDNYIVIDTDIVFSNKPSNNKECVQLREIFKDTPKDYLFTNFDEFYLKVLEYFKNSNKIIIIDSAQYRNIKDYSILKGQIIVMRTSIETCYKRVLKRWKSINKNYSEAEFQKYAERKLGMFKWYHSINKFLKNIQ